MADPETTMALERFADRLERKIDNATKKGEDSSRDLHRKFDTAITPLSERVRAVEVGQIAHEELDSSRFYRLWWVLGGTGGALLAVSLKVWF